MSLAAERLRAGDSAPAAQPGVGIELAEMVLEARDLELTESFYKALLADRDGSWERTAGSLTYRDGQQRIELVHRARPRVPRGTGQHLGIVLEAAGVTAAAERLAAAGSPVHWWREDAPAERSPAPYMEDPSGNLLQLVAGDAVSAGSPLLDHVTLETHDLELAEAFYVGALGGTVSSYHGWRMDDYAEAKAWERGDDPCAPWTRRFDVRYWDKVRVARPNMQIFLQFGSTTMGLVLAREHRQEPPPEILRGTPRCVLGAGASVSALTERLAAHGVAFEQDASRLFVRDPGGNYLELRGA